MANELPRDPRSVAEELCGFLRAEILAEGAALDATTPFAQLGIDSLSIVELLLFIERRFGIRIPESQLTRANLHSVAALVRCACGQGCEAAVGDRGSRNADRNVGEA